jgi:ribosomal protein S18 acetylase RimI-like enzyme
MKKLTIRPANNTDLSDLLPLLEQLEYPTSETAIEKRFERFVNKDGYGITVACLDEEVIGFIAWSKSLFFVSDKTRFHIEAIAVDEAHKRLGAGKKLIDYVEEIAKKAAPSVVDLTSGVRRASEGIHEFYKNLGYKNDGFMAKLYLKKEFL